eukprot:TRINITY_DN145_c1_g2_i1.p1 TRINITY_DN145_c1_g2~~TRINITY_DN145_c1_g2_i1.p1  ORF type:complete len:360 (-),score=91.36 TRINITY_DN145_c1_g2_i1:122-1105(-)
MNNFALAFCLVLLLSLAVADDYTVTASSLNVRSGPGTSYSVVTSLSKGKIVSVTSISNGWAKISSGYVSSQYLTKVATTSTSSTSYTVTTSALNMRSGPGTGYSIVKVLSMGDTVLVTSITSGWAKCSEGYVSSQYISKTSSTSSTTTTTSSDGLTSSQLSAICPNLSSSKVSTYLPYLNAAMKEASINTKLRIAHFMAQVAHESGGLYYWEEIASGAAYEGRTDLGNTQTGDGVKYKGRGPIQITGRANYKACGTALGLDLINNPTLLAQYQYGFRSAGWYWTNRNINAKADADDITACTKAVNGGTNGLSSRKTYLARAKSALGI